MTHSPTCPSILGKSSWARGSHPGQEEETTLFMLISWSGQGPASLLCLTGMPRVAVERNL